ncbi:hypothetical protein [Thauera sp. 2A1]|uniref:hypothetical protein n=1 Tax=Thauera sp. 2A1 TaxID=2570191 RepID=UPI001290CB49|nr:hypothetical protein [Thauera sp. 2A1]KAI5912655.1 hypothetical protein GH664_21235 [Thauera sp. 2A1]
MAEMEAACRQGRSRDLAEDVRAVAQRAKHRRARETMMAARMSEAHASGMILPFAADVRPARLSRKTR